MDKKITIEEVKKDHHRIYYKGKFFGVVEYRWVYGNHQYYAFIDGLGSQYNTFEDAVAHLFWRHGFTVAKANKLAGVKD